MNATDRAHLVFAHFGIPADQAAQHDQVDTNDQTIHGHNTAPKAARAYRAIYGSLSMEELLATRGLRL